MTFDAFSRFSDADLIARAKEVAVRERRATTELIVLLAEIDTRRLYLSEGCASLFTYCTQVLGLSESAAYGRITAARTGRRFPSVLSLLASGEITLTTVALLSAHLTDENYEALLGAAKKRSRRDVELLVASLVPAPDVPSTIRKLPKSGGAAPAPLFRDPIAATTNSALGTRYERSQSRSAETIPWSVKPSVVAPITASRYLLRVTLTEQTHAKLERARSLLRHVVPDADLGVVLDRALTMLVKDLERTRLAVTTRPRRATGQEQILSARSRRVPAAIRRAVWTRDGGQCAFVGRAGRCRETSFLEFHHVTPYGAGGATTVDNLQLRCRAHNQFEASEFFGSRTPPR
jgi:5-methylcytosine-specific restriction endonuclease McrA